MRAVVMRSFGAPDVLEVDEVDDPAPGPGEALVRVASVEVSSTRDLATRTGLHPFSRQVSLPHVLGGDFAGVVEATGAGVDPALVGRRVAAANSHSCGVCAACLAGNQAQCPELSMLGIHRWGSYAELATVPVSDLNELPADLELSEAAAMAATGPIALAQLTTGRVGPGTWLLVTGATGALGTALVVLGAELGARVIGLSRRPEAIPPELPLAARLSSQDPDLTSRLLELTDGAGVEVAIDNVSAGEVFSAYFPGLAIGGRVVVSGAIGGAQMPVLPVPAAPLYLRSLSLLGVRTASAADIAGFWAMVQGGFRFPGGLVHELPLSAAAAAHDHIASGASVAHTVLSAA